MADKFKFLVMPKSSWPVNSRENLINVMLSDAFLVQIYAENDSVIRLTICKNKLDKSGQWEEGIAWEELQAIKQSVGYGDSYGIEVYPREVDIVNVANMRHL